MLDSNSNAPAPIFNPLPGRGQRPWIKRPMHHIEKNNPGGNKAVTSMIFM